MEYFVAGVAFSLAVGFFANRLGFLSVHGKAPKTSGGGGGGSGDEADRKRY